MNMLMETQITEKIVTQTVPRNFLDQVGRSGGSIALRWKEGESWNQLSYAELAENISRVATGLTNLGVGEKDTVMLMLRNRYEFHILDLACLFIGAVPVSLYNTSSPEQIVNIAKSAEVKTAVVEDCFADSFTKARSSLPGLITCISVGNPFSSAETSFDQLLSNDAQDLEALAQNSRLDSLATLIYTSGTTGEPKGVMLDNANISWTVSCLRECLKLDNYDGLKVISYLPMAHIAERMVSHYVGLICGFQLVCCPDATDLGDYVKEVRPNILFGVPRVYEKIYAKVQDALNKSPLKKKLMKFPVFQKKLRQKAGLDELVIAVSGGAAISPEIMSWFHSIGVPMSQIYGLSETSGPLSWHPYDVKVGTAGPPCPGVEVKLNNDGEVLARGGNIFRGYHNDPQKTAEVLDSDGWFSTGDIGVFDESGHLKIVDRKKELIVTSGGKNVSPSALENALKMIPLVSEAMVLGDGQKFISALVTLDSDYSKGWASNNQVAFDSLKDLANSSTVIEQVESDVSSVMKSFNSAEQVKKVCVLGDEWLPDSEFLTPTAKLKRKAVMQRYSPEIQQLYQG